MKGLATPRKSRSRKFKKEEFHDFKDENGKEK